MSIQSKLTFLFLTCLAFAMVFFAAHSLVEQTASPVSRPPSSAPAPTLAPTPTPTPTETPAPQAQLQVIKEWTGTGIKTTEPFTINNKPWVIDWTHTPALVDDQSMGILQIMVYNTKNPDIPITIAANSTEAGSDTSYIYETGTFFLTINAANTNWKVKVLTSQ